jgi:putative hydrolase of the HAD superfamily
MSKQIILFDVDGVLVHGYHTRPDLRKCWDENLQKDFEIDRERFKTEFIYDTFIKNVLTGKKNLQEELTSWLPTVGYQGSSQTFIDYWLRNDANINHDLIDRIKLLKASGQVRLFIATNQEHNRASYLMKEMGFADFFEDIFYSARIGAIKPDKAYFDWIAANLRLSPGQRPIFFDDTPKVVEAAQNYGWEAIEFEDASDLHRSCFVQKILAQEEL